MSTRSRLLDEALELLVEEGFDALSIRRLASRCGLSIGGVQNHFPTKGRLVSDMMARVGEDIRRETDEALQGLRGRDALERFCRALAGIEDSGRPRTVLWIVFVAKACSDPTIAAEHRRLWSAVEGRVRGLLVDAGVDVAEAGDGAGTLLALLDGLAVARAVEPERMGADRAERILTAAVRRWTE